MVIKEIATGEFQIARIANFGNKNWEIMNDEFNKILSFFVNNVNAEKAAALQLINYRDLTQDTLKFI